MVPALVAAGVPYEPGDPQTPVNVSIESEVAPPQPKFSRVILSLLATYPVYPEVAPGTGAGWYPTEYESPSDT